MRNNIAHMIYEKWCADLRNKDKSIGNVYNNFYELFDDMKKANIDFDGAYPYLEQAVRHHNPSPVLAKNIYKTRPNAQKHATEQDFLSNWKQLIKDTGTSAFYDLYPLKSSDDDVKDKLDGEVSLNGMSREEYNAQREYVKQFPKIDFSKLPPLGFDIDSEEYKK